jgi:hypothetical protein
MEQYFYKGVPERQTWDEGQRDHQREATTVVAPELI